MKKYIKILLLLAFSVFSNSAIAQYCTPTSTYTWAMGISNVQINTINNYTGNNNSYTNTNISTDLIPGNTYSITIQGYSYQQYASVWIDYNGNNVFDTNERVVSQLYLNYTGTANFTIPTSGITSSVTRMRIKTDYSYSGNSYLYPCANPQYGETEDYTVRFISKPFVITKNITVQLDVNGNTSITPQDVDNGSYDSDGQVTLSIDKTTFNCDDLGGNSTEVSPTFAGQVSQNSHSIGAAYDPFKGEFLYPQWLNYTVYRYDENRASLGSYTYPHRNILDLWVDGESGDYFSLDYYNRRIYRVGSTNNVVWSVSVPSDTRAITSDEQYVYTHGPGYSHLRVYNKTNGAFVTTLAIPFSGDFRSLIYANGKIYIGGNAYGGTLPNTWNAIHIINASDGSYVSSFATSISTSNGLAFDGEVIWAHNGNSAAGYKVAEGNAYGNGGSGSKTVILTVTDPLGYSNCGTAIVTVEDNIAPTITLNGDAIIDVIIGETFTDPEATTADNCSAEVEIIGTVDVNTLGEYILSYKAVDGAGNESDPVTRTVNVVPDNEPPIAVCQAVEVSADDNCEGLAVATDFDFGSSDPDGDDITFSVSPEGPYAVGETEVTLTVTDSSGETNTCIAKITVIDDEAPELTAPGSVSYQCIDDVPAAGMLGWTDNCDGAGEVQGSDVSDGLTCPETITRTWSYTDVAGNPASVSQTITVNDTEDPELGLISAPAGPVEISAGFALSATYSDCNAVTATWSVTSNDVDYIDYVGVVSNGSISLSAQDAASFETGVFKVVLDVVDDCGNSSEVTYEYVVIYDPSGGFVTGGGWFNSLAGNMPHDLTAEGKASFGFVAKYKTGKNNTNEVDGNTNFQFKEGNFHFKSSLHTDMSLVISGERKATYKGMGTVNGSGAYGFMVTVVDGEAPGAGQGDVDTFRIKVWDGSPSNVVYDNEMGSAENTDATTTLGGGSIVIHKPKGKNARTSNSKSAPIVEDIFEGLELVSWPNPTNSYFNIKLKSKNTIDQINIQVFDLNGRLVSFKTGDPNQVYQIGSRLQSGLYFINVVQGSDIKTVKLIKY